MRNLPVLFLALFILSCNSSVPGNVLPPKKMQAVLWDVMQADETADYYAATDTTFKGLAKHVEYYQKVFAIHKISKGDFARSLAYYENHPARLKSILDSLQSFAQNLVRADTIHKSAPPVVKDSILKKRPFQLKRH